MHGFASATVTDMVMRGSTAALVLASCLGSCTSSTDTLAPGDDTTPSDADVASAIAALRRCELYGEGEVVSVRQVPLKTMTPCQLACFSEAPCNELHSFACDSLATGELDQCLTTCALQDAFTCPSGAKVAAAAVCDGQDNCVGGEDEADCPEDARTCAVDAWSVCDGFDDCGDGSDEQECEYQRCDGEVIPPRARCDGWDWCSSGEDERGCAPRSCDPL